VGAVYYTTTHLEVTCAYCKEKREFDGYDAADVRRLARLEGWRFPPRYVFCSETCQTAAREQRAKERKT
jgi:hypothetical protein